jgi:hypothetical protein
VQCKGSATTFRGQCNVAVFSLDFGNKRQIISLDFGNFRRFICLDFRKIASTARQSGL